MTKSDGLDSAIAHAQHDLWAIKAKLAVRQLARSSRSFDADTVLELVGAPPAPEWLGAIFAALQRSGEIEAVGARVARDHRLVRIWTGVPDDLDEARRRVL